MKYPNDYCREWTRHYALLPKSLENGYTVWLCYYWKRYVEVEPKDKCKHCHVIGYWEYKSSE